MQLSTAYITLNVLISVVRDSAPWPTSFGTPDVFLCCWHNLLTLSLCTAIIVQETLYPFICDYGYEMSMSVYPLVS